MPPFSDGLSFVVGTTILGTIPQKGYDSYHSEIILGSTISLLVRDDIASPSPGH